MSQKKPYLCVPLDAIRVEAIPQKQCYNKKRYEKMCMLQRVSGNLIGCVEPIGNKYHGTNPKSFAKETPQT